MPPPPISLTELARSLGLPFEGDGSLLIHRVASLANAGSGDIAFFSNRRHREQLATTRASAVIIPNELKQLFQGAKLVSENPQADFARVINLLMPRNELRGVHPTADVDSTAQIHSQISIGPNVVIGANVRIGQGCVIGPNCVIGADSELGADCCLKANVSIAEGVRLGRRVLVHQGAVIGADGFGLAKEKERWLKIPQIGGVTIGDDVEVGANTTIDRGAIDDTVLEDGVKLDNQIQVAHNVRIGANTAIAACVGIAGSAQIGARCTIGGAAVVLGHLTIVDDVHITAMSLVTQSIDDPGVYSSGTPLESNASWHRNYVRFKQLDDMAKRLKAMERELKRLKEDMP